MVCIFHSYTITEIEGFYKKHGIFNFKMKFLHSWDTIVSLDLFSQSVQLNPRL